MLDTARRRERLLEAARGYLLLEMPEHALQQLRAVRDPQADLFDFHLLRGEALRSLGRCAEALDDFRVCYELEPQNLDILMGLAWCYKRVDCLPQAIAAMQEAYRAHDSEAVVLYNLACYHCLAGNKHQALSWLGRALRMDHNLCKLIDRETDFDPLRHDPDFRHLLELAAG